MRYEEEPADLWTPEPRLPADSRYDQLQNIGQPGWPRALLMVVLGFLALTIVTPIIAQLLIAVAWFAEGRPGLLNQYSSDVQTFAHPGGMFAAHLGLASLIVVVLLILRWIGGLRPAWASSVQPGMRWRYVLVTAAAALVVLVAVQGALHGFKEPMPGRGWIWFLLIIVLTSPLQAAAEEFLFRGLFLQAVGAFTQRVWVPILLTAVGFAAVHGVQNLPLFLDRFVFGIVAGALVVVTGGLEASIALHVANNLVAFMWSLLFSSVMDARTTTQVTWLTCGIDSAVFLTLGAIAWGLARIFGLERRTPSAA